MRTLTRRAALALAATGIAVPLTATALGNGSSAAPAADHAAVRATTSARAAVPTVEITPGGLDRGGAPSVPWAVEDVLHVGDTATTLPGYVTVLGRSDTAVIAYVAGRHTDRIIAVRDAGGRLLLDRVPGGQGAVVSEDGRLLFLRDNGDDSMIRVLATDDGHLVASRKIRGFHVPIGGTDEVVYLGGDGSTLAWTIGGGVQRIVKAGGDVVAPGADLLATVSGQGDRMCTTVRQLSDPSQIRWESCTERVVSIAPSGGRLLTTPVLFKPGGDRLALRTSEGDLLARYRGPDSYFDRAAWEDDATALVRVSKGRRSAYVRCAAAECEQAGGVAVAPPVRG